MNWLKRFNTFCFLDNHQYQIPPHTQECLVGAGVKRKIALSTTDALTQLQQLIDEKEAWLFGHLAYDLQLDPRQTKALYKDNIGFEELCFFEPEIVVRLNETTLFIDGPAPENTWQEITLAEPATPVDSTAPGLELKNRLSQEEYLGVIRQLRQHIIRGDCYEINFCVEFFAENAQVDPFALYQKLSDVSPNPFSSLYRQQDQWLLCASPERYFQKQGSHILSQPIKGTAKRIPGDEATDFINKEALYNSSKDRSENVMVVDLVRNDLARICKEGSVKVDELYGIYSFPQVHQMISTISGELREDVKFSDIIRASFPMGSMTGAPKKKVMELIARYEKTKRGLFSGTIGYISPGGDMDFNVVIRSILYNASSGYLSFPAGSGITFYSDPQQEWEECMMKVMAMKKVLMENSTG